MINPARFGAGGGGGGWTPASLPGLQAWYLANTLSGADGSTITSWPDSSGNGFTATASGAATKQTNIINGKSIVRLAQTLDKKRFSMSSSLMNGATAGFYGAVANVTADPTSDPDNGPILGNFGNPSRWPTTNGNILEGFGTSSFKTVNPTPSLTSFRMYSARTAASSYKIHLDGTEIFTTGTNTVGFGSSTTKYIGASEDLGNHLKGDIAEIVICNQALSDSDREKLEGYFAHSYALTGNLPGGHPYLASPP